MKTYLCYLFPELSYQALICFMIFFPQQNPISSQVFQHLCDLVDDGTAPTSILKIAQRIILDGK